MSQFSKDGDGDREKVGNTDNRGPSIPTLKTSMPFLFLHRKLICGNKLSLFQKKECILLGLWPAAISSPLSPKTHSTGNLSSGKFSKGQRFYFLQLNNIYKIFLGLRFITSYPLYTHTSHTHINPMA